VHVDGAPRRSCITSIESLARNRVDTIERLSASRIGRALQEAWLELDVVQCGYCQSGQLLSAAGLLARNPAPSDADIDAAMAGNVCRCGTYVRIREGIAVAATTLAAGTRRS
jgi:isoquinoline 1-oxidoreductase alpha subunit